MMGRFRLGIVILICWGTACCALTEAFAQQEPKVYRLSLDAVTRLALENNFDIQVAKYDAWIARTDENVATSIYDTMFNGQVGYRKDKSKKTSTLAGSKTLTNDYNIGLSQKLPTGTDVSVDLTNNRNWSDSSFTTSPLTHESALGVTIEQDLGKNFFGIQDRGNIKITRLDIDNSEYTSLEKIEMMISQVQKSYWDLVLQQERVSIDEDMVVQAKKLYDLHQEKLTNGLVEIPEAIASEVNYRKRKNELQLAHNALKSKENILKLLLNQTSETVTLRPSEELVLSDIKEETEGTLKSAFENRRDYMRARNRIDVKNINLEMKKNNLWPEINLTATLNRNGLGDHFDESVEEITSENNPDFYAGLSFSVPILNTSARAKLKAAELEKAKEIIGMKLVEKTIAIDVIDQVRNCNVLREVAFNTIQIADLEMQKLKEEEKRFNAGRSETDMIIRFQEDVIQARLSAALAKYQHKVALVDLRVVEGVLLDTYWEGDL
nr:outer membrane protein [uncultured bacterium]